MRCAVSQSNERDAGRHTSPLLQEEHLEGEKMGMSTALLSSNLKKLPRKTQDLEAKTLDLVLHSTRFLGMVLKCLKSQFLFLQNGDENNMCLRILVCGKAVMSS